MRHIPFAIFGMILLGAIYVIAPMVFHAAAMLGHVVNVFPQ